MWTGFRGFSEIVDCMCWIYLAHDTAQWQPFVNMVMKLKVFEALIFMIVKG
jgi:hypothetical protein